MNKEFYRRLVDMYVDKALPEELDQEVRASLADDAEMAEDVHSLQGTLDLLHTEPVPEFSEESYQRILIKLYARGATIQPKGPTSSHLQYHLPIQG